MFKAVKCCVQYVNISINMNLRPVIYCISIDTRQVIEVHVNKYCFDVFAYF